MATAADVIGGSAPWSVDVGDCLAWLRTLPEGCVQSCVSSPPYYGLRDYGPEGQIGLEPTMGEYVARLVEVFREVRRVLRDDGTFWLNLGDSYCNAGSRNNGTGLDGKRRGGMADTDGTWGGAKAGYGDLRRALRGEGIKHKDLLMVPARVAIALCEDGWYLRSEIIWAKKSPMPQSVRDRPTTSHEMIYLLTKGSRYYYDQESERVEMPAVSVARYKHAFGGQKNQALADADRTGMGVRTRLIGERAPVPGGRNLWTVWGDISPTPFPGAHFATFPEGIPRRCLRLGASLKGCCPACGAPWLRQVERTKITRSRPNDYTKRTGEAGTGNSCANTVAGVSAVTTGWAQSCACPPREPAPCVVLDPFTGSGTTGAVARDLGMRFLGVDINPEYAEMARRRIGSANPLMDACDSAAAPPAAGAGLFDAG